MPRDAVFQNFSKPAAPTIPPVADKTADDSPLLSSHAAKLAKLTNNLIDIIKKETAYLEARDSRSAQTLHGEKNRMMAEYRVTMGHLQTNQHILGAEDSKERKFLRKLTDALREVLRDHARIVLRLKAVTEGVIKAVGEEVNRRNKPVMGYGRNAAYQAPRTAQPTSLALNQVI